MITVHLLYRSSNSHRHSHISVIYFLAGMSSGFILAGVCIMIFSTQLKRGFLNVCSDKIIIQTFSGSQFEVFYKNIGSMNIVEFLGIILLCFDDGTASKRIFPFHSIEEANAIHDSIQQLIKRYNK